MKKVRKQYLYTASFQGIPLATSEKSQVFLTNVKRILEETYTNLLYQHPYFENIVMKHHDFHPVCWKTVFILPIFWTRKAEYGERLIFLKARFLDPAKCAHYQAKKCHQQLCTADSVIQLRLVRGTLFSLKSQLSKSELFC